MWRRSLEHASQEKAAGMRHQAFRSSSARQSRKFRKEGFCKAIVACHEVELAVLSRVRSSASASTSLDSTGLRLGSSYGRLVSADARVRLIATSACLLAWQARLRRSSTACGTLGRSARPDTMRSWRRWRSTFRSLPAPPRLPRLGIGAAHAGRLLRRMCFGYFNNSPATVPGDISLVRSVWERPSGCIIPRTCGSIPTTCIASAFIRASYDPLQATSKLLTA